MCVCVSEWIRDFFLSVFAISFGFVSFLVNFFRISLSCRSCRGCICVVLFYSTSFEQAEKLKKISKLSVMIIRFVVLSDVFLNMFYLFISFGMLVYLFSTYSPSTFCNFVCISVFPFGNVQTECNTDTKIKPLQSTLWFKWGNNGMCFRNFVKVIDTTQCSILKMKSDFIWICEYCIIKPINLYITSTS